MSTRNAVPRILVVLTVLVVLSPTVVAAESDNIRARQGASEARNVLKRFVGHWKIFSSVVGMDGRTETENEETCGRLILGGKFVGRRTINSEGGRELQIIGFDQRAGSYVTWVVNQKRRILEASGKWDATTSTMTWTGTHQGLRFVAEEKLGVGRSTAQWRISDSRGRVLVRATSNGRRVSPTVDQKFFERALQTVPKSRVPELKPLHDFVGPWRETLVIDVPGRQEIRGAGTFAAHWVLGGAVQLWRGLRETSLGSEEYLWVFTYDPYEREHRAWWLSSDGLVVEYVGGRTPGSNAWRWQATGLRAGVRQSITFEAATPFRIESTMEVRQGSSGSGITLRSTATRDGSLAN